MWECGLVAALMSCIKKKKEQSMYIICSHISQSDIFRKENCVLYI